MRKNIIPLIICFFLGVFTICSLENINHLRSENKAFKIENVELQKTISKLDSENKTYKEDIFNYENSVDSLNAEIENRSKMLTKLSTQIKTSKVRNDTISIYLPVYIEKENKTDSLIRDFRKISDLKDSIIFRKDCIIMNDSLKISALQLRIDEISEDNQELNRNLRKQIRRKYFWQVVSGVEGLTILALII